MRIRPMVSVAGLRLMFVGAGPAGAADDEPSTLPEGVLAKLARMRAKGELQPRERDLEEGNKRKSGANAPACGSLNIGNVEAGKPGTRAPKEVIVVIKGPVVNADNKCSR
jgi:hypothetical protein